MYNIFGNKGIEIYNDKYKIYIWVSVLIKGVGVNGLKEGFIMILTLSVFRGIRGERR